MNRDYTVGGAIAGSAVTGGLTSLFTDNKKARIIAYLLGAVGGGIAGHEIGKQKYNSITGDREKQLLNRFGYIPEL